MIKNHGKIRIRNVALLAISGFTVVPLLQYLPLQIDLLLSGEIQSWTLSKEMYEDVGLMIKNGKRVSPLQRLQHHKRE